MATHHSSIREGRRKDQDVINPKFVGTNNILFLGKEPDSGQIINCLKRGRTRVNSDLPVSSLNSQ
jgi:hypothetical protein